MPRALAASASGVSFLMGELAIPIILSDNFIFTSVYNCIPAYNVIPANDRSRKNSMTGKNTRHHNILAIVSLPEVKGPATKRHRKPNRPHNPDRKNQLHGFLPYLFARMADRMAQKKLKIQNTIMSPAILPSPKRANASITN